MTGVFAITRTLFEHPLFAREPYTEREAWIWLIGAAAWQSRRTRVGRKVFDLARGELAVSERFMAVKWQWPKSRVHRFLVRLKTEAMIELLADHDATRITVCNYDKYAFDGTTRGPPTEPRNGPLADHSRTKEEELKNLRTDDDVEDARARLVSDDAFWIAGEIGKLCGFSDASDWPPSWSGTVMRVQTWLNGGWTRDPILAACREAIAKKRDGPPNSVTYFEKPIATFIARQNQPLPQVRVIEGETVDVRNENPSSGIIAAQDRLIARLANLNEPAPDIRGRAGENIVRMLPDGRRERP